MYNPKLNFHFVGIGGAGMSGLAEILLRQDFKVSGSDINYGAACKRLAALGANIYTSHEANNITKETTAVVYSSAIPDSNPELEKARELDIPIVPRAAVLAELMRLKFGVAVAGSHGKTSTSSLVASVLEEAELDPTVVIGGIVHKYGSTGKHGNSDYLVAEADESDRSFLLLSPTIAVVTNIDDEHMDCYGKTENIDSAFKQFLSSVPFYGLAVLCIDDLRVEKLSHEITCRKVTYGVSNSEAKVRARLVKATPTVTSFEVINNDQVLGQIDLPMLGKHFMQNALASVAVGLEFDVPFEKIQAALNSFQGVSRRIEVLAANDDYTLINDYAHHPTEIKATLEAVASAYKDEGRRLVVCYQPHRYSRTRDCWQDFQSCFEDADKVFISDIYPAGEEPLPGIHSQILVDSMDGREARYIGALDERAEELRAELSPGDVVICMGAGSIGRFATENLQQKIFK